MKSKNKNLKRVTIFLSGKCNLNCKHCYLNSSIYRYSTLSLKQVKTALRFFRKESCSLVNFSGGEPTLSPLLFRAIEFAKKEGYQEIGVSTNGTNPAVIDQINPDQVTHITFSLDGATKKTNDFIRGSDHFNNCIKSIKRAISRGFTTYVVFTANKLNFQELASLAKKLDRLGVDRLSINYISFTGNAKKHSELVLNPEEWLELTRKALKIKGLKKLAIRYPLRFTKRKVDKKLFQQYPCALKSPNQTYVFSNGTIYHCCLFTEEKNLNTGFVTEKEVIIKRSENELGLLKKMPNSICPAEEIAFKKYGVPSLNKEFTPLCIFHRTIILPKKS